MKKLVMCEGLPGSGKTTWALDQINLDKHNQFTSDFTKWYVAKVVRVNKDDIRRELEITGWQWSKENERVVEDIRDNRIQFAFSAGAETVISDDTNFARKHRERLMDLAMENDAQFEVKRFDTPIDECIRRDSLREGKAKVGEKVIRDMAERYKVGQAPDYSQLEPYVPLQFKPGVVICDLDGTLALHQGRNPYATERCLEDARNIPVWKVIKALSGWYGLMTVYLSGRSDKYRAETEQWLEREHCPTGPLFMRTEGDWRKDWIVKSELFDKHLRHDYNVQLVLDDRNQVVNMWRAMGLVCFQVAQGDF